MMESLGMTEKLMLGHRITQASALLALFLAAWAISPRDSSAERASRFTMQAIDGGILRLDSETGSMALCTKQAQGLICEVVGEPASGSGDSDRLAAENRELRAEIKRLEALLAMEVPQKPAHRGPRFELPSEEDVDKALGYMERMLKKFRDKFKDLEGGRGRGSEL